MTVLEILNWSTNCLKDHQIENPRLNAELLLSHSLSLNREELYVRLHSHNQGGGEGNVGKVDQKEDFR